MIETAAIKGKWALITGASSGIGEASARALAGCGCNLILLARRKDRIARLAAEIKEAHKVQIEAWTCDLKDRPGLQKLLETNVKRVSDVSILVNNAGLARGSDPIPTAKFEDWEEMLETNLYALLFLTREILPHLMKHPSADIVNLGSVAGRWVYPGGSVYNVTKFGVRAFSEALRFDLLGKNIRVVNIEPGMVETEFSEVRFKDKERAKSVYAGMTPLVAGDVADAIVWTLTRPRHVNIQEMVIYPTAQASPTSVFRK